MKSNSKATYYLKDRDMPDHVELLESLVKQAEDLPFRDKEALDALRKRAEMLARLVFGNDSSYLEGLSRISFSPQVYAVGGREPDYAPYWKQGHKSFVNLTNTMLEEARLRSDVTPMAREAKTPYKKTTGNNVFVVHGHDEEMKRSVALVIQKLGLNYTILHEQLDKGLTVIEKLEAFSSTAGYAVVLLSPDDKAIDKTGNESLRARQNVILELGWFLGQLGRERVAVLFREHKDFELPSDYKGVLYIPYTDAWEYKLAKELSGAGFEVDLNKL